MCANGIAWLNAPQDQYQSPGPLYATDTGRRGNADFIDKKAVMAGTDACKTCWPPSPACTTAVCESAQKGSLFSIRRLLFRMSIWKHPTERDCEYWGKEGAKGQPMLLMTCTAPVRFNPASCNAALALPKTDCSRVTLQPIKVWYRFHTQKSSTLQTQKSTKSRLLQPSTQALPTYKYMCACV